MGPQASTEGLQASLEGAPAISRVPQASPQGYIWARAGQDSDSGKSIPSQKDLQKAFWAFKMNFLGLSWQGALLTPRGLLQGSPDAQLS